MDMVEEVDRVRAATPGTAPVDDPSVDVLTNRVHVASATAPPDLAASMSFEVFCRREMPRLVALARALCGSSVADDLAQEAMLDAYRRWPQVGSYDSPEAWVRRVCANHATSLLRRRAAEGRALLRLASRPPAPGPLEAVDEAFWTEIRRLPRRQAQASALRYVYDMSVADIALTLECSEGAVKVHLTRARAALVQRCGLRGDPEESS
jgi:RNA polymerase sigma factor (sigma-70 family)